VSADNIENLTMIGCKPGANAQAEKMTLDLFRLFSQYYLQIKKFGKISHFVCDFMEDSHGLVYLLQIKSFECEGIIEPWQARVSTKKTIKPVPAHEKDQSTIEQTEQKANDNCKAGIICNSDKYEDLRVML